MSVQPDLFGGEPRPHAPIAWMAARYRGVPVPMEVAACGRCNVILRRPAGEGEPTQQWSDGAFAPVQSCPDTNNVNARSRR